MSTSPAQERKEIPPEVAVLTAEEEVEVITVVETDIAETDIKRF